MAERRRSVLALTLPAKDAELARLSLPGDVPLDCQCIVLRRERSKSRSNFGVSAAQSTSKHGLTYYEPSLIEVGLLYLISAFRDSLFVLHGLGWSFRLICRCRGLSLSSLECLVAQDPTDPLFFVVCRAQRRPISLILIDDGAAARIFSEVRLGTRYKWLPPWLDPVNERAFVMSLSRIWRIQFVSRYTHRSIWPDQVIAAPSVRADSLRKETWNSEHNDWILSGRLKSTEASANYLKTMLDVFEIDPKKAFYIPHQKEENHDFVGKGDGITTFRPKQQLGDFLVTQMQVPQRVFTGPSTFVDEWISLGGAPEKVFLIIGPRNWYPYPDLTRFLWEAMCREYPLINGVDWSSRTFQGKFT